MMSDFKERITRLAAAIASEALYEHDTLRRDNLRLQSDTAGMRALLKECKAVLEHSYNNVSSITADRVKRNIIPQIDSAIHGYVEASQKDCVA